MLAPKKKSRSMRERHAPDCHMKTSISPFSLFPSPYSLPPTYLPTYVSLSIMSPSKVTSKDSSEDSSEDGSKSLLLPTAVFICLPINVGAICSLSVLFYAR